MSQLQLKINPVAEAIIKRSEGLSLKVYLCPANIPTIGWGSIWRLDGTKVQLGDPDITRAHADLLFAKEVNHTATAVLNMIHVHLNLNQLSALVSFAYNVGTGHFRSSTLRSLLNRGDYLKASEEFWKWRRGGGVILRGLVIRRELEKNLFNTPII
jgi:lysozyme